jgi:DNA-binding transcriptional ArsR family regulator
LNDAVPGAFDVIADPARRALLDLLLRSPRPVGDLATATGLSQPNTSRHLRILREAGLVQSRVAGQRRVYELVPEGFAEVARWLAPYVVLWQGGPDALPQARAVARASGRDRKV